MAVKPLVQPEIWASNALYTTGPFIGSASKVVPAAGIAAEGHRPGANFPTPAEYENSQQNAITLLSQWTFAGSFAGGADAHICEVDSSGEGQVERWRVVPSNAFSYAMFVQAPPNAGFAIQAAGGSLLGDATIIGLTTGPGAAIEGVSGTAGACFVATPSGSGAGFSCTVGGTGQAMNLIGGTGATAVTIAGGSGQSGMLVSSGNNGAVAAQFIGAGTALGIVASGGANSASATGVRGDALHADAVGVHGRTSTSASTTASGVHGEARGSGTAGVHADGGVVGRGLVAQADASSPAYSAMRVVPQDADPTSATSDGEVIWHANHKTLRTCVAGYGYRSMPTMGPGSALIVNETSATTAADGVAGGGLYSDVLTAMCSTADGTGVYGQAAGAEVFISVSFDVRTNTAATNTINVGLIDVTNGNVDIARWAGVGTAGNNGFFLSAAVTSWQRTVVCNVRYPIVADGDLEVKLEIGATGSAAEVRNVSITIMGTF